MRERFHDRIDAGRRLAKRLAGRELGEAIILALPRGGVPVGFEIAEALNLPLDVFLVRKLGTPGQEELAMGAIATGGVRVLNEDVVRALRISDEAIDRVARREAEELERRERLYRGERSVPRIEGRTAILVDDGLATGSTMRAAVRAVRLHRPAAIIVAVPTGPPDACSSLRTEADEVICEMTPSPFEAVGLWYEDFSQTTDTEVQELLRRAGN